MLVPAEPHALLLVPESEAIHRLSAELDAANDKLAKVRAWADDEPNMLLVDRGKLDAILDEP